MNLRSGHGTTSAGAGLGLGEGQDDSGHGNENGNRESHEAPILGPPPPPPLPPSMTQAVIMAQAIGDFARGGPGGNGGNEGGARSLKGPCSYQDFLKTHPPTFMLTIEPLDVDHWLRILEQKF
jgi:hypothetical protein